MKRMLKNNIFRNIKITFCLCVLLILALLVLDPLILGTPKLTFESVVPDLGITLPQESYSLVEFSYEDKWVDAICFAKIEVPSLFIHNIISDISRHTLYKGEIASLDTPTWWRPTAEAKHIAYYTNQSASPIIVMYIDDNDAYCYIYLAVIPA